MKKFRVFCTDPDATDSSSCDEDDQIGEKPTKRKRFLREITLSAAEEAPKEPILHVTPAEETPGNAVKYPGVRRRKWGKYASEIRHPINKVEGIGEKVDEIVELPDGVRKVKSGKWGARIRHPKTSDWIWLGRFDSAEEAVRVYKEKEGEFEGRFKNEKEDDVDDFEGRKLGCSVRELGYRRWEARVWHPRLKTRVLVGVYSSRRQAELAYKKKKVQFQMKFRCNKRFAPKCQKVDRSLRPECGSGKMDGCVSDGGGYAGREIVIALPAPRLCSEGKAMNSEFVKAVDDENENSGGVELPAGVRMTKSGRFGALISDPVLGTGHWLGSFKTLEEAGNAVNRKMAEFEEAGNAVNRKMAEFEEAGNAVNRKMAEFEEGFRLRRRSNPMRKCVEQSRRPKCGCENTDETCGEVGREVVNGLAAPTRLTSDGKAISLELFKAVKSEESDRVLPKGVKMTKSGRFGARVTHPVLGTELWLGSYFTLEEAVNSLNRKTAEFEKCFESRKRVRPDDEVINSPKKTKYGFSNGSPTSILDCENENIATMNSELKNEVADYGVVHGLPSSDVEPGKVNGGHVNALESKASVTSSENQQELVLPLSFDDAVRLGIMNQYGQLLGEYSKYDEPMWLSDHDEGEESTDYS
ncbi:uncharacterized protein LOC104896504 [Beta vulgaris subsp. vulgaris]|uniref:uncharacterized protein LOC104896504 n=1 Tax=Beta vulgaris subsp. vulgaris TaxID=3555 RepID=UPI002036766C|nr:uncharacterized protein LOC104896504 [Beta vulgaris subsp. vulgaris]